MIPQQEPTLGSIGDQSVNAGDTVTITLTSTSQESYTPTYSVDVTPTGSTLVDNVFTWTTDVEDSGQTELNFTVTDDGGSDSETITITVNAWSTAFITLLRVLIDDYTKPYTYSTATLNQILCVSANTVRFLIDFKHTYTIDFSTWTISPTPTESAFINLTCLFAAYTIGLSESKNDVKNSVQVVDDLAKIDLSKVGDAKMKWTARMYQMYKDAQRAYKMGDYVTGDAIVSPYTR